MTRRTLLALGVALAGCWSSEECDGVDGPTGQLLTTGEYRLQPDALPPSFPSSTAHGPVAVSVDRAAGTVRLRWTRPGGAVTEETWRLRN